MPIDTSDFGKSMCESDIYRAEQDAMTRRAMDALDRVQQNGALPFAGIHMNPSEEDELISRTRPVEGMELSFREELQFETDRWLRVPPHRPGMRYLGR